MNRLIGMVSHLVARYRWLIIVAVGVIGLFLLSQRWHEFSEEFSVLARVDPRWIAALVLAQAVAIALSATTFRIALALLGHDVTIPRLVDIHLRRHLAATLTPFGSPASIYVFVRACGARGIPANDAMFAMMLRGIVGYTSFVLFVIPVALAFRPSGFVLAATGLLLVNLVIMVALLVALLQGRAVPARIQRRVPQRVMAFVEQAHGHGVRVRDLVPLLLAGVLANLGNVAVLFFALRAVGEHAPVTTAATGYAVGNLFQILAPVFQGIGIVEVSMVATLRGLDVTSAGALGATMLFRLADLWLPFAVGLALHAARVSVRYVTAHAPAVTRSATLTGSSAVVALVVVAPALTLWANVGFSDLLTTLPIVVDARLNTLPLAVPLF